MATFNTAFGSLPGYNEMLGTTNTTGGGQQSVYGQRAQQQRTTQTTQAAPAQTFAQLQKQGMARPAPPQAPQAQAFAQYGGSQQAQQMRQNLQQQLQQFGQAPSRFDTQAFQQIRGAQAANLQAEYGAQQKALNEELARRGLSASSVGGGRMGDLAGQQARALADIDAQLLQRAAETQAQDRAQLLQAGQGFAELAGAQDLAQFEANRVAQAATFENQLRAAQFGQQQFEQGGQEAFQAAQAEESAQQAARQFDLAAMGQTGQLSLELQRLLGQQQIAEAELTGTLGAGTNAAQTLQARQTATQERQLAFQNAQRLSEQSGIQYTVDNAGNVVVLRDAAGNPVRTSADTRAAEALKLQEAGVTGLYGAGTERALTQDALQNAYARAAQLSQITGQQYDVNPNTGAITLRTGAGGAAVGTLAAELQRAGLTGQLGGQATLDRLQQNLQNAQIMSQITGRQYTVDANGALVVAGAGGAQTEAARQADLDMQLRRQLGLTEASGYIYDLVGGNLTRTTGETVQGQIARSQTLLALANALKDLDPTQLANLLGRGQTTTQSSGTPTTQSGTPTTTTRDTGVTTTTTQSEVDRPPTNPTEGQVWTDKAGRTYRFTGGTWVLQTTTTTGSNTTTASNTTTTASNTTTAPNTPTTASNTTTRPTTLQEFPAAYVSSLGVGQFDGQYRATQFGNGWAVFKNGKWYLADTTPTYTNIAVPGTQNPIDVYPGATYFSNGQYHTWNGSSWTSRTTL